MQLVDKFFLIQNMLYDYFIFPANWHAIYITYIVVCGSEENQPTFTSCGLLMTNIELEPVEYFSACEQLLLCNGNGRQYKKNGQRA